jgi:hypothetical protein
MKNIVRDVRSKRALLMQSLHERYILHLYLKSQFHRKKSILTIKTALAIQKVIVCANETFAKRPLLPPATAGR